MKVVKPLSRTGLRRVLQAAEIMHALDDGPFHERLFRATRHLFQEAVHAFEVYGLRDGSHTLHSDMQWPEAERASIEARIGGLVQQDHPIFPLLREGNAPPARLSDLIVDSKWTETELYKEVFVPADVRYQIVVPFAEGDYVGGLTINRAWRDWSERDLDAAKLFGSQVVLGYRNSQVLTAAHVQLPRAQSFDHTALRKRGLSRRESEVLFWVARGKRNVEIAVILGVAARTIELHLTSVYRKLEVDNRAAAVAIALDYGAGE